MRNIFAFILLLGWLGVGGWYYTCQVLNLCAPPPPPPKNRMVVKKETVVQEKPSKVEVIDPAKLKKAYLSVFSAEEDMTFKKNEETLNTTPKFNNSIAEIANFLKKHPQTSLTITGFYTRNEKNSSSFENLGKARANQVKQLIVQKGVPAKQLILADQIKTKLFNDKGIAKGDGVIDFKYSEAYEELNETDVKSAYKALFKLQALSQFSRNGKDINMSEELETEIQNLIYYLNRNKDQGLEVKVDYEKAEESGLKGQNIGLLRAYNFKQRLVTQDIDPDRVVIGSKPKIKVFDAKDQSLPNSIQYNFIFPDKADEAKLAEIQLERDLEKALSQKTTLADEDKQTKIGEDGKPVAPDIFFSFGSDEVRPDKDLDIYVKRLIDFLNQYPSKRVFIIGHTCDIGEEAFNYSLGLRRAEAAKSILVKKGVDGLKLLFDSRGETMPAYPNTNYVNRIKNRRVEIDIQ